MIVLVARYAVRDGQGDAVEAALREMAPLVRSEPGCRQYQVIRSTDHPERFLLVEHYDDEAALAFHRATPHFKAIIEGRVVPLLEQREWELYRLVAG